MDDELDEEEDDCTEPSRNDRCDSKSTEDGSEALAVVPSPLDIGGADCSDPYTSD